MSSFVTFGPYGIAEGFQNRIRDRVPTAVAVDDVAILSNCSRVGSSAFVVEVEREALALPYLGQMVVWDTVVIERRERRLDAPASVATMATFGGLPSEIVTAIDRPLIKMRWK